jgi:insecticidal toxin complex protein TccC
MTHANTPIIEAFDPRGLGVRGVTYHRRDAKSAPESYITQQTYDVAGRPVLSRDPRLFLLYQDGQTAANQTNVSSLSGNVVLSKNTDAGWRLGLLGADGQGVQGWDQKLSYSRVVHDRQRRPIAVFERAKGEPEHCTARFSYADANAEEAHNRRGQLIRHDDTAGTLHFTEFSLAGMPLQHSRTFVADPQWAVDWPGAEPDRDVFLENQPAITRIHCNAAGEPISQTDALGNRQTFSHTRAAELREVRLKLTGQTDDKILVSEIQYNAFGQIERQRAGNGVISCARFCLDDGRLAYLKACVPGQPALQELAYEYDAVGNITCITDAAEAIHFHRNQRIEPSNHYRYDSLYRLIEASGRQIRNAPGGPQLPEFPSAPDPGELESYTRIYTYDKSGNLKVMQHQAASASRTECTAIARLSNRSLPEKPDGELPDENEIAVGYDLNGNRIRIQPGQNLLWDRRNQLRQVDQVVREDEPDDIEFYLYDGSGQRQRKIRKAYTGTLTRTHETRYLPSVEIRTSANEILHVITVKAGRGTVQILHWEKGQPTGIPQDQHRYSFTDHLGSSSLELDEAALLISRERYYPYGGTCWWAGRDKLEANYKTLRYSGQERDATGLYYYGFRYYVPWCQRWLNADPTGIADGLNLFAMVHGNPVRFIDMQGLSGVDTAKVAGAGGLRETSSAMLSLAIRYGVVRAIDAINPANVYLTATGATAGAISGAITGYGAANWAQSTVSTDNRWLSTAAKIGGAVAGAAVGAAPSVLGHFTSPGINMIAATQVANVVATGVREFSAQYLSHRGPTNPFDRFPDVSTTGASVAGAAAVSAAVGYASGVAGAELQGEVGRFLQTTLFTPVSIGASAAAGAVARDVVGNTSIKPAKGGSATFDSVKAVTGAVTRHAFVSVGQLVNETVALVTPGYAQWPAPIRSAVREVISNVVGEGRAIIATAVTTGISAELDQNSWNIEMGTMGSGMNADVISQTIEETSIADGMPVTIDAYMVSQPDQRHYSRAGLNF